MTPNRDAGTCPRRITSCMRIDRPAWLWVVGVTCGLTALLSACAGHGSPAAAPIADSTSRARCEWGRVATPNSKVGHQSQLVAVSAPSLGSAWAVGNYFSGHEGGPSGPIVERWDGRRWTLVPQAAPAGAFLADVSADAPRDVWIAGTNHDGNHAFAERWDGRVWHVARLPTAARYSHLFGIEALAPDDVWAVGNRSSGRTGHTLVLHWNGTRWRIIASPSPAPTPLTGHPYATLESVHASSPRDIWTVGESVNVAPAGPSTTLILHWDGTRWSRTPTPNERNDAGASFDTLFSVDARAPGDVWAAGSWNSESAGFGGGGDHSLVEHWDGRRWRIVSTPITPQRQILYAILVGRRTVLAAGDQAEPYRTLLEQRAHDRWQRQPTQAGSLAALSAAPGGRLWAVGQRGGRTLALTCPPA